MYPLQLDPKVLSYQNYLKQYSHQSNLRHQINIELTNSMGANHESLYAPQDLLYFLKQFVCRENLGMKCEVTRKTYFLHFFHQ